MLPHVYFVRVQVKEDEVFGTMSWSSICLYTDDCWRSGYFTSHLLSHLFDLLRSKTTIFLWRLNDWVLSSLILRVNKMVKHLWLLNFFFCLSYYIQILELFSLNSFTCNFHKDNFFLLHHKSKRRTKIVRKKNRPLTSIWNKLPRWEYFLQICFIAIIISNK